MRAEVLNHSHSAAICREGRLHNRAAPLYYHPPDKDGIIGGPRGLTAARHRQTRRAVRCLWPRGLTAGQWHLTLA